MFYVWQRNLITEYLYGDWFDILVTPDGTDAANYMRQLVTMDDGNKRREFKMTFQPENK